MSDISYPVTTHPSLFDSEAMERKPEDALLVQAVQLLKDIRTELRVMNEALQAGLNLSGDLDQFRSDPYFKE